MKYPVTSVNLKRWRATPKPWKYEAIADLKVGECFYVPFSDLAYSDGDPGHTVRSTAWYWGRRLGRKFSTRREEARIQLVRTA